jgi:hypothetical protein
VPEDSVHDAAGVKVPVELVVNVTVPVGVPLPDVTVAVQVEAVLSRTLVGEHATDVVLAFRPTASRNVPLLPVWTESPL